jgi:hypothetical protein
MVAEFRARRIERNGAAFPGGPFDLPGWHEQELSLAVNET